MQNNIPVKISRKYLDNIIPENLFLPFKALTKKQTFFFSGKFKKSTFRKSLNLVEKKLSNLSINNFDISTPLQQVCNPSWVKESLKRASISKSLKIQDKPISFNIPKIDLSPEKINSFTKLSNKIITTSNILLKKNKKLYYSLDQFFFELTKKQTSSKKLSEFAQQQKERKKLAYIYGGLSKKQLLSVFEKAKHLEGSFAENLLKILESRLDVTLVRACFFKNISTANQWISHKKIVVNNKIVNIPGYLLQPGDVISIKKTDFLFFAKFLKYNIKKMIKKRNNRTLLTMGFCPKKEIPDEVSLSLLSSAVAKHKMLNKVSYNNLKKEVTTFVTSKMANNSNMFKFFIKNLLINSVEKTKNSYGPKEGSIISPHRVNALDTKYQFPKGEPFLRKNKLLMGNKKKQIIKKNIFFALVKKIQTHPFFCYTNFFLLQFKSFLKKKKQLKQKLTSMRYSPMKPINLEVSYKILTIIYLYSPQKITFPASINFDLIYKSFK
jgi:ribosomal protein S4